MHDIDDESIRQFLGETILDHLKAMRESVSDTLAVKQDTVTLKEEVFELKTNMKAVKAVLKLHDINFRTIKTSHKLLTQQLK